MTEFEQRMFEYKEKIDSDVAKLCHELISSTKKEFGDHPAEAVKAYCEILGRGGKRMRGVLTITSYYMHGGINESIALRAALAVEMLQAYILITDDIQDQSVTRRGGPSAHVLLKNYHKTQRLRFDSQHFGESIAMNSMLFGVHSAIDVLAGLDVEPDLRLSAIKNVNKYFISTAHGQTLDIFNEVTATTDEASVNKVLTWKTAFYSILNPLQLGAILAGADEASLRQLLPFSLEAGRAFQIADDIIGIFGDDEVTGKSAMDDIKEGKRTILSVRALQSALPVDAEFLEQMLGNTELNFDEFERCKEIIKTSGALEYAKNEAELSTLKAVSTLEQMREKLEPKYVDFLIWLTERMTKREK